MTMSGADRIMARIFINYRRGDAPGVAGRLGDRLANKFSKRDIFIDVDAMKPGLDFVEQLDEQVAKCDVLLAVIGLNWINATNEKGQRKLDLPRDYVRIEIASALKRGIPVIPLLVDGAEMPQEDDLPEDLRTLPNRHAMALRHISFVSDTNALIQALNEILRRPSGHRQWIVAALAMILILSGAGIWLGLKGFPFNAPWLERVSLPPAKQADAAPENKSQKQELVPTPAPTVAPTASAPPAPGPIAPVENKPQKQALAPTPAPTAAPPASAPTASVPNAPSENKPQKQALAPIPAPAPSAVPAVAPKPVLPPAPLRAPRTPTPPDWKDLGPPDENMVAPKQTILIWGMDGLEFGSALDQVKRDYHKYRDYDYNELRASTSTAPRATALQLTSKYAGIILIFEDDPEELKLTIVCWQAPFSFPVESVDKNIHINDTEAHVEAVLGKPDRRLHGSNNSAFYRRNGSSVRFDYDNFENRVLKIWQTQFRDPDDLEVLPTLGPEKYQPQSR
jgi:hypothetical protein